MPKRRASVTESDSKKPRLAVGESDAADDTDDTAMDSGAAGSQLVKKTVTFKGKAPVDALCPVHKQAHVYYEGDDVYDVTLNQTDLSYGLKGHNKFYIIQLLEEDDAPAGSSRYFVWQRWGRVGANGQSKLDSHASLSNAKSAFEAKFHDKTHNLWEERQAFERVEGKYDWIEIDYSGDESDGGAEDGQAGEQSDTPSAPMGESSEGGEKGPRRGREKLKTKLELPPPAESKLHTRVQQFVELICNVRQMEQVVMEMEYDSKKAPLGKLSAEQIKAGYQALQDIESLLMSGQANSTALLSACSVFYTRIPHSFGMKRPQVISSLPILKKKLELLETLGDIRIALKIMNERVAAENPLDTHYRSLRCDLVPLDTTDDRYHLVQRYVKNTHGPTHTEYTLSVLDVFEANRELEGSQFQSDMPNRQLLWHGSRTTNMVGILSQGLRIAPPEAPVTGYMFGKGIYFADMVTKSSNYCAVSKSGVGVLLLCEVALGNMHELVAADYHASKLPSGMHSTKGLGEWAPDPSEAETIDGSVTVPLGMPVHTGVVNPKGYTLKYNEYIVYDMRQVRIRFVVKCKFNHAPL